ncbi:MAG: hypothetical protein ACM3OC_04680, partial [Deltaproteobacteria bacterium]
KDRVGKMINKFVLLMRKDLQLKKVIFVLVAVLVFLFLLVKADSAQGRQLKSLQAQQQLVSRIPTMREQLHSVAFASSGISLNGIISGAQGPIAIINNALCKVGDTVDSRYKVISIENRSVKLNDGEKDFEVQLEK